MQIGFYEWQSEYYCRRVNCINWTFEQNLLLLSWKEHHHHLLILKQISLVLKSISNHSSSLFNFLELDSTIFVWWWWCLFLKAPLCVCTHMNHHIHTHRYIVTDIYWILNFPLTIWKSTYLLKVPEYAKKLDFIESLFNYFNCNIVGVAGYVFLFHFLFTLKSSAWQKQKFEIWAVVIAFFFSCDKNFYIFLLYFWIAANRPHFSACQVSQQYNSAFPTKIIKNKTPLWVL